MNHFPFHIGDYIKSTVHLTNEEDLTYFRLICHYYDTEKPIPKNTESVAKRLRLKHRTVLGILAEFFTDFEDGWHSKRCDEELSKYHGLLEIASKAGKASAAQRLLARSTPVQRPLRSRSTNQEPRTSNQEPITKNQVKKEGSPIGSRFHEEGLSKEWENYCLQERPDLVPASVFEDFRDYWLAKAGKDSLKANWFLTWKSWVRRQNVQTLNGGGNGKSKFNPVQYVNAQFAKELDAGASQETVDDLHGKVHPFLSR